MSERIRQNRLVELVWEVGFVLVQKRDTRLHISYVIGGWEVPSATDEGQ